MFPFFFLEGGRVSVVVFQKTGHGNMLLENPRPFGMYTTFWHVVVLTDSWVWVCQPCGSDLEMIWMSFGQRSHYRAMVVKGWCRRLGGRLGGGGGVVGVDLLCNWLSTRATDGREYHVPRVADAILHSCPIGRGCAKIAGLAHNSLRWVCGMRSKHSHRSLSGGARSALWPRLIRQASECFHTGGRWDCGPPA